MAVSRSKNTTEVDWTMKIRVLTGVVGVAILLPVLWFSDTWVFPAALALMSAVGVWEMLQCMKLSRFAGLSVPLLLLAAATPLLLRGLSGADFLRYAVSVLTLIVLYTLAVLVFTGGKRPVTDVGATLLICLYIIAGFSGLLHLRDLADVGQYVYLLVFLGAWMTDTFAYFCGRLFGRHKLAPLVSPKKTVEGSVGGILFCALSFLAYGLLVERFFPVECNLLVMALAGVAVSVVSQIGDLAMSVIKRQQGIKDYGKLFPGHGGVLDRFDSVLAVAVVLAVLSGSMTFFTV
jgi:phosphatidate cytidylyltransferase